MEKAQFQFFSAHTSHLLSDKTKPLEITREKETLGLNWAETAMLLVSCFTF